VATNLTLVGCLLVLSLWRNKEDAMNFFLILLADTVPGSRNRKTFERNEGQIGFAVIDAGSRSRLLDS